jgi:ectoine hydroxylase-related dioxygenase (phytanoyl-CoA dioxygenase family)
MIPMVHLAENNQSVLPASLSDELWNNGHVLIRQAAAPQDIAESRNAIVRKLRLETPALEQRSTYDKAFLQVTNLWQKDEAVKRFVFERGFAQIAANLLGVGKVRLYHDQALFKEPDGGHTPWHQDKYYWPLDTDKMITMWMPLVDIDEEMGLISFASGSHLKGGIDNVAISDESDEVLSRYVDEQGFAIDTPSHMRAGDATFHLGWTIHSAGPNRSNRMREVMTIIYFADGAKISEPAHAAQLADLEAWFPGQRPGDIADSPLNPIMN